jgi:probable HAF family extracellular repeat protein
MYRGFRSAWHARPLTVGPDPRFRPRFDDLENRQLPSTIIDLGTLGGSSSAAYAINDRGQVVGYSSTSGDVSYHAFLWDAQNGMQDLGTLPGGERVSTAYGINDRGQVVGRSLTMAGPVHAFLRSHRQGMQDLGTLGGDPSSEALGINNRGQVVGTSFDTGSEHAFLWDRRHGLQDLGTLGGSSSAANGINDLGQVVGGSSTGNGSDAFLWDRRHGLQDLGNGSAYAINDAGQVVGESTAAFPHAIFWDAQGGRHDLGTLPGALESAAQGLNDAGEVVGWSNLRGGFKTRHAILYRDGTLSDLNDFLPPNSGWTLEQAQAINDAGQIVGIGEIDDQYHAFLLTLDGGDQAGAAAIATNLSLSQIAGTLREISGISVGSVRGTVVGIGLGKPGHPSPGPMTEASSALPSRPSQGPSVHFLGPQGETSTSGPLDGLGDALGDLGTLHPSFQCLPPGD